jgi:plastocyanin
MTWRSLIFFSAACALAADVSGVVELTDSRAASVRKQRDFSGVAVWLEPAAPVALTPEAQSIVQKGKKFTPHITIVPTGSSVDFPNLDPIFHNAFSNVAGQPFDTGLYPPGGTRRVRFQRPGIVRVFCNIHSTMSAVILVVDSPYFALTDRSGAYRIRGVAPGEYTLRVWHERATAEVLAALSRKVLIGGDTSVAPLAISEAGYLAAPHKNKHGLDYPPAPEELGPYPGGKK